MTELPPPPPDWPADLPWPDDIVAEELDNLDPFSAIAVQYDWPDQRNLRRFGTKVRRRLIERDGHAPGTVPATANPAYTTAAVENVLAELSATTDCCNSALNNNALRAARLLPFTAESREWLRDRLIDASHRNGYIARDGERDAHNTIDSAFRKADADGPAAVPAPAEPDVKVLGGDENFDPIDFPDDARVGPGVEGKSEFDLRVQHRVTTLRVEREARRRLDAEDTPAIELPPVRGLRELLDEPDAQTAYRIDGLAPSGGRVMLSAQFKAGKTTLVGNLVAALADKQPFLSAFAVNDAAHRLVLIDDELSEPTLRRWLRAQEITNTTAVADVISLRGRVGTFNLLDDDCRSLWARRLRDIGCDYVILDCLRPVLDALGLDENHDAGQFLVAFDALLYEAGVSDALLVQHMGHANERARGDSRLQDWPDAIWRLVRESDEPDSPRYFTAYGRDVDVPEGRLSFDQVTRRLTYAEGSRGDAKTEAALRTVVTVLADQARAGAPGLSGRAIEQAVVDSEHSQKAVRDAIKLAIRRGVVVVSEGSHRANIHSLAHPCAGCGMPVASGRERHESCPASTGEGQLQ